MSLYHLDPRMAGTGAKPDVETYTTRAYSHRHGWQDTSGWRALIAFTGYEQGYECVGYLTEAAALAGARLGAGFGHVTERACDKWQGDRDTRAHYVSDCVKCAWPRNAHGKEG